MGHSGLTCTRTRVKPIPGVTGMGTYGLCGYEIPCGLARRVCIASLHASKLKLLLNTSVPAVSSLPPAVCHVVTVVIIVVAAVVVAATAINAVAAIVALSLLSRSELQRHLAMTPAAGPGVMGAAAVAFETCVAMSWWLVVRLGLAKLTLPGDAGFALLTLSCTHYQPPPLPYHRQQQDGVDNNDEDNNGDNDNFDKAATQ
ncbi:hypothetical protein EDB85DRAFT_1901130 [Lactarius pseudohatsudake]|nr:hypothetical protein EDB85DRAFT_1901130 [Lactarius pseudohatsudake]